MNDANAANVIFNVVYVVTFVIVAVALPSSMVLFSSLKKKYPKYYKKVGSPTTLLQGYDPKPDTVQRSLNAQLFWFTVLIKGLPTDFPKDQGLRKLVNLIRWDLLVGIIIVVPSMILVPWLASH